MTLKPNNGAEPHSENQKPENSPEMSISKSHLMERRAAEKVEQQLNISKENKHIAAYEAISKEGERLKTELCEKANFRQSTELATISLRKGHADNAGLTMANQLPSLEAQFKRAKEKNRLADDMIKKHIACIKTTATPQNIAAPQTKTPSNTSFITFLKEDFWPQCYQVIIPNLLLCSVRLLTFLYLHTTYIESAPLQIFDWFYLCAVDQGPKLGRILYTTYIKHILTHTPIPRSIRTKLATWKSSYTTSQRPNTLDQILFCALGDALIYRFVAAVVNCLVRKGWLIGSFGELFLACLCAWLVRTVCLFGVEKCFGAALLSRGIDTKRWSWDPKVGRKTFAWKGPFGKPVLAALPTRNAREDEMWPDVKGREEDWEDVENDV